MTYQEFIQNIIDTRGQWNIPEGEYYEKHHIVPKCIGGLNTNDNIIYLYAKEHFIAHKLLAEENPTNYKLVFAYSMLVNCTNAKTNKRDYTVIAEDYETARILVANACSERYKGQNNPMYNIHRFGPTNPNYGKKHPGLSSGNKNGMYGKHFSHSSETKELISQRQHKYWEDLSNDDYLKRCERVSGRNNGMYGKCGKLSPRAKPVYCIELNLAFESVTEAMNTTKINKKYIRNCCNTGAPDKFNNHWCWQS